MNALNEYLKKRYRERRRLALEFLGGSCVKCGSEEKLELDHINPATKDFDISRFWGTTLDRFWTEVKKCQILCKPCHIRKTVEDHGQVLGRESHGTLSSYKYCKCTVCRDAVREYHRKYMVEYRKTHIRKKGW